MHDAPSFGSRYWCSYTILRSVAGTHPAVVAEDQTLRVHDHGAGHYLCRKAFIIINVDLLRET